MSFPSERVLFIHDRDSSYLLPAFKPSQARHDDNFVKEETNIGSAT